MIRFNDLARVLVLMSAVTLMACGTDNTDDGDVGPSSDVAMDSTEDIESDTVDMGDDTSDVEEDTENQDAGPSTMMPGLTYRSKPTGECAGVGSDCVEGVVDRKSGG